MAIQTKKFIDRVTVFGAYKQLQVIGREIIKEGDDVLAEKVIAFAVDPQTDMDNQQDYQVLPASEKAKVDELINLLWTDQVKANYQAFLDAKYAEMNPE